MPLAQTFDRIVGSLPSDWTDLELDLRISDPSRYVEAVPMWGRPESVRREFSRRRAQ